VLGIVIGIASVILLTSLGEGTRRAILSDFTQFGTNIMAINKGRRTTSGIPGVGGTVRKLTIEDAEALKRVRGAERVLSGAYGTARVAFAERSRNVLVSGVTAEMPEMFRFPVRQGRFVPAGDPRRGAPVAVLGPTLKRELFGDSSALGGTFVSAGGGSRSSESWSRKGSFWDSTWTTGPTFRWRAPRVSSIGTSSRRSTFCFPTASLSPR
jgi:putative ABC transport system permease protein